MSAAAPTSRETMRAIVLDGPGSPAELRARRAPAPDRADEELVVAVEAAAVNRSDLLNVLGLPLTSFPRVPGRDFAGTVLDGPSELRGRRCWGTGGGDLGFRRDGSHAERLAVPAGAVLPVPESWTVAEAGAAGLSYLVAADGLRQAGLGAEPGQTVLVTGAAGGVGAAASAIVSWRGANLVAAVLDEQERDAVLAAHPDAAVAVTGEEPIPQVVAASSDGRGAAIVYDTVGNAVFADCLASLGEGGRMIVITATPGLRAPLDLFDFYRRGATLMTANSTRFDCVWAAGVLRELTPGFEAGALPPPSIAEELPLERCAEAYGAVQEGRRGRVVLRFGADKTRSETP